MHNDNNILLNYFKKICETGIHSSQIYYSYFMNQHNFIIPKENTNIDYDKLDIIVSEAHKQLDNTENEESIL